MFNHEESQVLLTFLGRVNINGNEAESMVYLKNKVRELTEKPTEKPKDDKPNK